MKPQDYIASFSFDQRLAPYDVAGSIAHVRMLARQRIIPSRDASRIVRGLRSIARDIARGKRMPREEDIHFSIEKELIRRIGEVGKKMHTARSRNDQVALDLKLYVRDAAEEARAGILRIQKALLVCALRNRSALMPGYTHLQHGQPLFWSHHLLSYGWMWERDDARFRDLIARLEDSPLGACAFAGTAFPIDRAFTARALGFARPSENSVDSVSDRDFIAEFLFACSMFLVHASRLAEEMVLWTSSEFGFVEIPENLTSGSSIMPQKRNPDTMELLRGKSARAMGNLTAILALMKGLPLSYNRDLQDDKPPLFDTADQTLASLDIIERLFQGLKVHPKAMEAQCKKGFLLATELADYLAREGVPFRAAHATVRDIINDLKNEPIFSENLEAVSLKFLRRHSPLFKEDVYKVLSPRKNAEGKNSYGGTGKRALQTQIRKLQALLRSKR